MVKHLLTVGAALLVVAAVPSVSLAGFTTWSTPTSEPGLLEILDAKYGLHNLERVHDFGTSDTDEVWANTGAMNVSVVAKYSNMSQHFGVMAGDSPAMSRLMTVRGRGDNLDYSAKLDQSFTGESFRFSNDPIGERRGSSRMADNYGGVDQMVTWRIVGNDGFDNNVGGLVVAFEDRPTRGPVDYNDLILEVQRTAGEFGDPGDTGTEPVPEPGTLLLLGMGAAGLAASRRRKKASAE